MNLRLGINMGFAINKYIEPRVWTKIVAEDLGLHYVQFVADLLNPFWPAEYIEKQITEIQENAAYYDVKIESMFTSAFTRVNHLMNPDEEARKFWLDWFKKFLEIGSKLGAKSLGSHFGILTFDSYNNPSKREFLIEEGVKGWQQLSYYAQELGYECLIFEPMSVPREMANTIEQTRALQARVNANCGIPMKICLDVGHAPDPSERDPYPWVLALASESPVIHLQQTVLNKSNHAPFTPENNRDGIIQNKKLLEYIEKSGCRDALLAFEISHREAFDTEFRIVEDLKASVDYFREYVKE